MYRKLSTTTKLFMELIPALVFSPTQRFQNKTRQRCSIKFCKATALELGIQCPRTLQRLCSSQRSTRLRKDSVEYDCRHWRESCGILKMAQFPLSLKKAALVPRAIWLHWLIYSYLLLVLEKLLIKVAHTKHNSCSINFRSHQSILDLKRALRSSMVRNSF